MSDFIPVYKYAQKYGVSEQKVYRLIREGKILPERVKKEVRTVERIAILDKPLEQKARM
jgi:predicted DNA-binding transcriptional regulator AlpA